MLELILLLGAQASLKIDSPRTVFVRGETATFSVAGGAAEWDADGLQKASGAQYQLSTATLAPGEYTITAHSGTQVGKAKVTLVDAPNPERFAVWKWGGTSPRSFAYFSDRGFTGAASPMISAPQDPAAKATTDIKLSADQAAKYGIDYGIYLNPLMDPAWKAKPEVQAEKFDGSKLAIPYPRDPEVMDQAARTAQWVADTFKFYPAWKQSLLGSEFQLDYNFGPKAVQPGQAEANVDVRKGAIIKQPAENLPKEGVIEDDNPRYKYLKWWFHKGMGDAALNKRMSDVLKTANPNLTTWHDPYRLAPVYGAAAGLDAISSWTYAQPDMTRLLFTRVMQAAAKPEGQKVMQTVTLFTYPRFIQSITGSPGSLEHDKPDGNDYLTAGPDFAREATWMAFSQRPDILGYYYGGMLQPDDPNVDKGRASPETFDAIGDVIHGLVEPYGPAIREGKPEKAAVAVLLSAAAIWMGDQARYPGYPNEQILPYCSLLAMNHVPFEVVLDDDIVNGKLSGYQVLVMPQAGALTRSMLGKIQQFAGGGGKVIADKSLIASIPGAIKTDYDFSFQNRVDGVALSQGNAVTADENRRKMEDFASDLRSKLPQISRSADADSPRAIINVVEAGPVKYVFVVNDNRDFGPRFGGAKLNMEKGVPLSTKVTIHGGTVYDAMTGAKVSASIAADLPAAGGKLYVVLPGDAGEPTIAVPAMEVGKPATITVKAGPSSGSYPVRIEVLDPTGKARVNWCVATHGGAAKATFLPAENDPNGTYTVRATDLVTRKVVKETFER